MYIKGDPVSVVKYNKFMDTNQNNKLLESDLVPCSKNGTMANRV
jgi:hypothetical protein